jgi:hypothetical protein
MTTSPSKLMKVCSLHEDSFTIFPFDRACPFCVQIERYERLKKQYELVKDQLEIAEQPTRD